LQFLSWVLKHPAVTSDIVGARIDELVVQNIKFADNEMDDPVYQIINELIGRHI